MRSAYLTLLLLCFFANPNGLLAVDQKLLVDLGEGQSIELILVKHGTFQQGSPASEASRSDDESQHKVTLTKDFFISKTPITVGQFRRFVAETKYKTEAESGKSGGFGLVGDKLEQRPEFNWKNPGYPITDQHPVTIVTVADVVAFSEWLSKKAGRTIQLPSESQWEFACRGGTESRFYSGDDDSDLDGIAWYKKNAKTPMPVAQKKPNAFGLFDMSGNVFQWCGEFYAPYSPDEATDPQYRKAPEGEPARVVLRGGSFMRDANRCRSAARYRSDKGTRNAENGFRVASIVTEPASEIAKLLEGSAKAKPSDSPKTSSGNSNSSSSSPSTTNSPTSSAPAENTTAEKTQVESKPVDVSHASMSADGHSSSISPSPAIPGMPPIAQTVVPSRSIGLGVICAVFFLFLVVVVIGIATLIAFTKPTRPNAEPPRAEPPRAVGGFAFAQSSGPIRTSNDGFWLHTASYVTGSIVFYHYFILGSRHDGSVVINSGGQQFIYTGDTPANVSIDRVEEPDSNINTPYDNNQQGNWNQYQQGYSQQSKAHDHSRDSSSGSGSVPEPSPDRELLGDQKSSSFPPAY